MPKLEFAKRSIAPRSPILPCRIVYKVYRSLIVCTSVILVKSKGMFIIRGCVRRVALHSPRHQLCPGRLVMVLEGGYNLRTTAHGLAASVFPTRTHPCQRRHILYSHVFQILTVVQPILPDYYTHYYKNACSECVHVIDIVIPI